MSPAKERLPRLAIGRGAVWHELECGCYRADMALWRKLGAACAGPILDVGAGTGRVALPLASAGHPVTALELDHELLAVLGERAAGLPITSVRADARSFRLAQRDFALCVVAMQTIQLFGGAAARGAFMRRVRAHLRPGGVLACAILTDVEPFDCASGDVGPAAESVHVGDERYVSRPTRVSVLARHIRIERERRILVEDRSELADGRAPVQLAAGLDVIELDRLSAAQLEREGIAAGLSPLPRERVPATDEHLGSTVVMLRG